MKSLPNGINGRKDTTKEITSELKIDQKELRNIKKTE